MPITCLLRVPRISEGPGPFVHSTVVLDLATPGCIQNLQKSVPKNLGLEIRNQGIHHLEYVGLKVTSQHGRVLLMEAARNFGSEEQP